MQLVRVSCRGDILAIFVVRSAAGREPFYAFSLSVTTVILSLYEFPEVQKRIRSSSASSGCLSRRRPFVVKIDSHGTKTSSTTVK